jgi:hypothetical protein
VLVAYPVIGRCKVAMGVVLCLAMAACASDPGTESAATGKTGSWFAAPVWAKATSTKGLVAAIGPDELISADGRCGGAGPEPAGTDASASAETNAAAVGSATVSPAPSGAGPAAVGGIGLGMSECEVVRRAGSPENLNVATDQYGERAVVLTYLRGTWPGIYRFNSGRLVSIERVAQPEPAKPKKIAKPAKPRTNITVRPGQS